jgi:hypothetical protein
MLAGQVEKKLSGEDFFFQIFSNGAEILRTLPLIGYEARQY